jgi:surface antigen
MPLVVASLMAVFAAGSVAADPPDHAPAHGWRRNHERDEHRERGYVGYEGRRWDNDYAVLSGRCDRQAVAAALGGVVGGVIGARVGDPENRAIATIIGAVAGALIGNRIGRELDEADRGCFGHALELGRPGRVVVWTHDTVRYELLPGANRERHGTVCREFTMTTISGRQRSSRAGLACRTQVGGWEIQR